MKRLTRSKARGSSPPVAWASPWGRGSQAGTGEHLEGGWGTACIQGCALAGPGRYPNPRATRITRKGERP
ncbi:hypothetical protein GCM10027359_04990 [Marilutibacter aestuarii]